MRTPQDLPRRFPRASRRTRIALAIAAVVLVILIFSLRGLAGLWTDYLWFQSVGFTSVFRGVLLTKILLSIVFVVIFFAMMMASLTFVDRLAPLDLDPASTNELVLRYRDIAINRSVPIRVAVSFIFALLAGVGADREWNNWDLFRYHVNFGINDAQYHRDVGFYVFELPFIRFLIGWAFEAVVVVLIVTVVAHYLTGGIVPQASAERVRPAVKAHLSVLLGLLALIKAVAYYYDRLALVLSRNHVVNGATATAVHADAPAKFLLMIIAVISAVFFLANIRQRGWALPAVGVALWALVSVLVGAAYPAAYQALRVGPSELTREAPYIQRNIDATRLAYGLDKVNVVSNYSYSPTVTSAEIQGSTSQAQVNQGTLANVRLLDPAVNLTNTFNNYQKQRAYYSFNALSLDRYPLDVTGTGTPQETATISSVRELNSLVPSGFVNRHLEYTHGNGAVLAPVSEYGVVPGSGTPQFVLSGQPATSSQQATQLSATGANAYYGVGPDTGGYVIANSKTAELDYESASGQQVTNHYNGQGVDAGSIVRRAAFALRFWDANFLLSGQVTPSSKVLYYRNIVQRAQKAAPFLKFDSDPYSVVLDGQIYWVVDAYTTSDNYPYAQNAVLDSVPPNSGLNTTFNYVRNSVKVVTNASTGAMYFFDMNTGDPILKAYERAFPDLFTNVSKAEHLIPGITQHWRYPEDLFQVQTNMYGRYHLTKAADFYSQAQAWAVSPDPGSGPLNQTSVVSALSTSTPATGAAAAQPSVARLAPQYVEASLPGSKHPANSFLIVSPFVPISSTGSAKNLTAFMAGSSDPGSYGQLTVYALPAGQTVDGPGLIANAIHSSAEISQELTFWNTNGSEVELGQVDLIPIDNTLLYVEPIYVESTSLHIPSLDDVVVVYNGKAYHSGNTSLDNALCKITNPDGSQPFSNYCGTPEASSSSPQLPSTGTGGGTTGSTTTTTTTIPVSSTTTPGTVPPGATVASLLAQANQDFKQAQAALAAGDLAAYQQNVNAAAAATQQAQQLAQAAPPKTG